MTQGPHDLPRELQNALLLIVKKYEAEGWTIRFGRPYASDPPRKVPGVALNVTAPTGQNFYQVFDQDETLPAQVEAFLREAFLRSVK